MTFNSSKLKNGLTILSYNMPTVNSVAINLIINVGGRYEEPFEEGMSHFLEHMAFKGTATRSAKQISEEFDSIGGQFNAYTGHEHTVYYAKTLSEYFPKTLEILADIIQNSVFSETEIQNEYQVILQEIAHVHDNPEEFIYEKFYASAYDNQALGKSILGSRETLSKFTTKHFNDYTQKHYNAENIYLSVAGNITHEQVVLFAENLFTSLPSTSSKPFSRASYTGGHSVIAKDLEQTTIILGFESISYLNILPLYHVQLLSLIFGGSMSSRLFQQIRENLGLAYSIGSYNSSYYDSGIFGIYTSTNHDKLTLLTTELINEIKKICSDIKDFELERAKVQLKSSIYLAQEKSSYKSEEIGKNFAVFGKYIPIQETIDNITNITTQDITNIAQQLFITKPTLSIIGPSPLTIDYQKLCKGLM